MEFQSIVSEIEFPPKSSDLHVHNGRAFGINLTKSSRTLNNFRQCVPGGGEEGRPDYDQTYPRKACARGLLTRVEKHRDEAE